ncbi:MAG: hypothetical protein HPY83_14625 [Anaerolineae bacterium]|nr:hypothetical protein [Anaerolineae bacterium]
MSHSQRNHRVGLATRLVPMSWPCRDDYTGSLLTVPPGLRRRDMFCFRCTASTCLLGGTPAERRLGRRRRQWALPDERGLEIYLDALRLYTRLLAAGRTCWHCAHLRRLQGSDNCYACAYLAASRPADQDSQPTITAWQAQLSPSLEVCGDVGFQRRRGEIPQVLLAEWRELVGGRRREACCAWCAHLRRFSLAGRERFICALEAEGLSEPEVWRRGRSWKVVRARHGGTTWCKGTRWEQGNGTQMTLMVR